MAAHAFRIPAPGRIELRPFAWDQPLPEDHVEGATLATAVSPGTELAGAFADQDPAQPAAGTGYAAVLRVEQAGPASGRAPGDIVFAAANHASRVRCAGSATVPVPDGLDPREAVLARLAGVGWSTLTTTRARPPGRVAVTGLGVVGNLAAQVFAGAGYEVLACDPVAARRELLAGRGIDVRERLPLDDPLWSDRTDLVVECAGHEAAVLDACRLVRKGGEVVLVGVPWTQRCDLAAFELTHAVFHRYVVLRSGWEWEVPREAADFRTGCIRANLTAAMRWFAAGRLRSAGLVRRADPRDCQQVYDDLAARRGALTAVFDWTVPL